jgi:flagellar motor switch protein FliN/FliY
MTDPISTLNASAPAEVETNIDTTVRPVQFSPLAGLSSGRQNGSESLDILMDVPLQISVELGRTRMPVKEVLSLQHGSVVELDRMAGEPVDVLVNDRLIARGEVVVIEDRFGIRITETISQMRRFPAEE